MLYKIYSSTIWCSDKNKEVETILREYPCLKDFGWRLVEYIGNRHTRILNENQEWIFQITPVTLHRPYIEINTLEEFQKLQAAIDQPLIFYGDEIEIYDGHRE